MTTALRLIALASLLAIGCVGSDSESGPSDYELRYAEDCTATFDCLLECTDWDDCSPCFEDLGTGTAGPAAALDAVQCGAESCPEACGEASSSETCVACLDEHCTETMDACGGHGSHEYQNAEGELDSCWDTRQCMAACDDDEECLRSCYWRSDPGARIAVWKLNYFYYYRCDEWCSAGDSYCAECVENNLYRWNLTSCLPPASGSSDCEGLSGAALCICVTGNIGAC